MASVKLLLLTAIFVVITTSASALSADILGSIYSSIKAEYWETAPTKEGYHFTQEEPNGFKREEMGMILNYGTEQEEMVIMGMYSSYDEQSGIETTTVYTADKDGYKPRTMIKNRKVALGALKSAAG